MKTLENWLRPFTTRQVLMRMLADLAIITCSLGLATLIRFAWAVLSNEVSATSTRPWLMQLFDQLSVSAWEILILSIVLLTTFGVYTHTRAYRGRYKAFAIGQAIALTFLIFGFISFITHSQQLMSRSVLLLGFLSKAIGSAVGVGYVALGKVPSDSVGRLNSLPRGLLWLKQVEKEAILTSLEELPKYYKTLENTA